MNRLTIGLLAILLAEFSAYAENQYYTTLSTTLPRTLALGGATTAVTGDPLSIGLNPATFRLFPLPVGSRGLVIFNPIGVYSARNAIPNSEEVLEQVSIALQMLVRFVGVSYQFMDLGVRFCDEIPLDTDRELFPNKDIFQFHSHTILLRFELHPYVSVGVQTMGYTRGNSIDKFGYSYGVLLRPGSRVQVGITYLDLPTRYQKVLHPLIRMADETVNIGSAVRLSSTTQASFDLRNITDENKIAFLEPHFGLEQAIHPHLTLRGGGALMSESDHKVISGGIAVFDWNQVLRFNRRLEVPNYAVQYGIALEYGDRLQKIYHTLTLCIRF